MSACTGSDPLKGELPGKKKKARTIRSELLVSSVSSKTTIKLHQLPSPSYLNECLLQRYGAKSKVVDFFAGSGWDGLVPQVDPLYHLPEKRQLRKRGQLMSMLRAITVMILSAPSQGNSKRLVDFCGGAGHVGLLVAYLFSEWEVVCVDRNPISLDLGIRRAQEVSLSNFRTVLGDVLAYNESFDIGTSLHACGAASDYAIKMCEKHSAGLIVASCCVGKICAISKRARESDSPEQLLWKQPKSLELQTSLAEHARATTGKEDRDFIDECFDKLTRFADSCESTHFTSLAKYLVELDRLKAVEDRGYTGVLCKMEPISSTPKNDIVIAWPSHFNVDKNAFGEARIVETQPT